MPVTELLGEVTSGLEHTIRLRDNCFVLDGDQELDVLVDRDRLKRALTNILDNALRYSPAGAPIRLGWTAADVSTVELTIPATAGPESTPTCFHTSSEPGIRGTPDSRQPRRWRRARPHDR